MGYLVTLPLLHLLFLLHFLPCCTCEMSHLRIAVYFLVPLEIRRNCQLHLQGGSRDRLNMNRQLQLREVMDVPASRMDSACFQHLVEEQLISNRRRTHYGANLLVNALARLGHADQFSNFVVAQIIESFPREVLLLDLLDHLFRDLLELPKRRH